MTFGLAEIDTQAVAHPTTKVPTRVVHAAPNSRQSSPNARPARWLVWTIGPRSRPDGSSEVARRALDAALDKIDIRQAVSTAQAAAQALVALGGVTPSLVGPQALLSATRTLRMGKRVAVVRPADVAETVEAWRFALGRAGRLTAIVVETSIARPLGACPSGNIAELGARVVDGYGVLPDVTILASGSDVNAALNVSRLLRERGHRPRVLSVPYRTRFDTLEEDQRCQLIDGAPVVLAVDSVPASPWRADLVIGPRQCDRSIGLRVERLLEGTRYA